jgi:hypothetical protein
MAALPLILVYKDGDAWRPLPKDLDTEGLELAYLLTREHTPITIGFGDTVRRLMVEDALAKAKE